MGVYFTDQFSLLHAATGVIAYFWNISLITGFLIHLAFEFFENSAIGIRFIQKYIINPGFFSWPGGKRVPDSPINMLGDNVYFVIGWLLAYVSDYYGNNRY